MIADDELVLLGSFNVAQRSIAHDSEIHLAIVDSAESFARDLRLALWQEHLELADSASIVDPDAAVGVFQANAVGELGRLRVFPTADPGSAPCCHDVVMTHGIDPYEGPERS